RTPGMVSSDSGLSSVRRRGGRLSATKTATAAERAAVRTKNRFTNQNHNQRRGRGTRRADRFSADSAVSASIVSEIRAGLERRSLVGVFPGEFRLRAAEVSERRGLLVDRPAQVQLVH